MGYSTLTSYVSLLMVTSPALVPFMLAYTVCDTIAALNPFAFAFSGSTSTRTLAPASSRVELTVSTPGVEFISSVIFLLAARSDTRSSAAMSISSVAPPAMAADIPVEPELAVISQSPANCCRSAFHISTTSRVVSFVSFFL